MKTLKSLAVLGLFLMSCTVVVAQEEKKEEKSPEVRAEKMTQKMSDGLGLDEKQTGELKVLNLDFVTEMKRIKSDESLEKDARKTQMQEIKETRNNGLKTILSAEEFAKYQEMEAKKIAEHKEKKEMTPEQRAAMHTEKMIELLDLSDEQIGQVTELNKKVESKIAAIKSDLTMTNEKKKEFIKGNRQDQKRVLKVILTPEQFETLQAAKKEGKHHGEEH